MDTPLEIRPRYRMDRQGERLKDGYRCICTCNCGKKRMKLIIMLIIVATLVSVGRIFWNDIFPTTDSQDVEHKICVWNALNYSVVNGLYSKTGPTYSKGHDLSCNANNRTKYDRLYLFCHRLSWSISTMPNNVSASLLKGRCSENTENLTECHSKWQIPPDAPQNNVNVTETQHCPQISCPALYLSFQSYVYNEPCHGPFKIIQKEMNLYQSIATGANVYLYFNPNLFRWVCGDYDAVKKCGKLDDVYDGYATEQSWYDAEKSLVYTDEEINIPWSKHNNLTIKCTDTATKAPTASPTKPPTASTMNPTISPSKSPTKLPTTSPTKAVTTYSGGCIASESFVFTYPYYERKRIEDLEMYEKILAYDELNDDYIWDELIAKQHFRKGEYMNNELLPMIKFILENNSTLTMTGNHLLYVNNDGLTRADNVKIGDRFKQFHNGYLINVKVLEIDNNITKYPRNLYVYNGNLVINGIAISQFTDRSFNVPFRFIMKYIYSYNIYRYVVYYIAKVWNEYS